jgi:hypothetical protein
MLGKDVVSPPFEQSGPDRRRGRRFPLRLACRVAFPWTKAPELLGRTVDISRSGVKVAFENEGAGRELPRNGYPARILIDLPHSPRIASRCLECWCVLVRTEAPGPNQLTAAFEIRRVRVCDRDGSESPLRNSPLERLVPQGSIQ